MRLEGSCHCRAVRFAVESAHPVPYQRCYCRACRKTAGAGGFAINVGAEARSLVVEGRDHVATYASSASLERAFCRACGSALWCYSPDWPDLIHPHASAIDTDLPAPPRRTHMMLGARVAWAVPQVEPGDGTFDAYPGESLAEWHGRMGMRP